MRKFYFFVLLFILTTVSSFAQVSAGSYGFSSSSGTYTEITGTVSTAVGDDGTQFGITIPFTFNYCGVDYTQFGVGTNGWMRIGPSTTIGSTGAWSNNLSLTTNLSFLTPLWDDMNLTGGEIAYLVTGTTPNQVLTVQWKNNHWSSSGSGTAPVVNFQVQLFETSNIIKFVYGTVNNPTSASASIGIIDATGGVSHFLSVTSTSTPTASSTIAYNTITSSMFLTSGLTYTFTPPNPCVSPVNQPSVLNLTAGSTTANGTFTTAAGVDGYLVVGTNTPPLLATPVDGNPYTAGTILGNGIIIQSGSVNTFSATGLTENTTYTVYIFTMNSQCTGGPKYNITNPLTGVITTGPAAPAAFTATAVSASEIDLSVTANTLNDNVVVAWNTTSTFGNPTGAYTVGSTIVGGGNIFYSGPMTGLIYHTGLNPSTLYYYKAWSVNSSNLYSNGLTASDTTFCSAVTSYPYSEGFESITTAGTLPPCWAKTSAKWNTYTAPGTYGRNPRTGTKFASAAWSSNDWLFTPAMTLTGGTGYKFSLWFVTDGFTGWDTLEVKYGSAANAASMATLIVTKQSPINVIYEELSGFLSPIASGDYYIGIRVKSNSTPWYLTIDDISLSVLTTPVAEFSANNLTPFVNQTVAFTDASSNPTTWHWTTNPATVTFADGTNSASQNPHINFTAAGLYSITLDVTNPAGSNSLTKTNYVNVSMPAAAPNAAFTQNIVNLTTLDTLLLNDVSTNTPTSWLWTFTPNTVTFIQGTSETSQNPIVMFNSAGSYIIQLTATNAAGSDSIAGNSTVTIEYCTPTYSTGTSDGDYIAGVILNTINNITLGEASPYYTYYNTISTDLVIGSTNAITLINGSFIGHLSAWIDFNKDGFFDVSEQIGDSSSIAVDDSVSFVFNVPSGVSTTTTRLRVREIYSGTMDPCGNSSYGEVEDYDVNLIVAPNGYSVTGIITYNSAVITPLNEITLNLMSGTTQVSTATSDINGNFSFTNIADGTYAISGTTIKPWGGVTATDALKMKRHIAGLELLTEPIRLSAADANNSITVNSTDVLKVQRRVAGLDASFARADWNFEKPIEGGNSVVVSGANVAVSLYGLCTGDVNGSYVPAVMKSANVTLGNNSTITANAGEVIELPIRITKVSEIGAIQLLLNYPSDLVSILRVSVPVSENELVYNIKNGQLNIVWSSLNSIKLNNNEAIVTITMKANKNATGTVAFELQNESEIADAVGNVINGVNLNSSIVELNATSIANQSDNKLKLENYPNPFSQNTNIEYQITESGMVSLKVFDILGKEVANLVNTNQSTGKYSIVFNSNSLQQGLYTYTLNVKDKTNNYSLTKTMSIIK